MTKIGFIGAGTVGTALAVRLTEQGYAVVAVASRTRSSAEKLAERIINCRVAEKSQEVARLADFVFITTPDDAIAPVADAIQWRQGQMVVHCSGSASTDSLEKARRAGVLVGSFHPLQTFADVGEALENLPGSAFAIEAEEPLLGLLARMVHDLGGRSFRLRAEDKVMYHAAAVIASNYTVALMKMATDLWRGFGVPAAQATQALLPLLRGTVNNIDKVGLPNCLTGPIARGDVGTLRSHLKALRERAPGIIETYRQLGLQAIPVALEKGRISQERAREMKALLESG
jgi:predicted short-subunit dehydrogenase-like oxidoreductase (DUF2520 family)